MSVTYTTQIPTNPENTTYNKNKFHWQKQKRDSSTTVELIKIPETNYNGSLKDDAFKFLLRLESGLDFILLIFERKKLHFNVARTI